MLVMKSQKLDSTSTATLDTKYRAPALEKGLDVMELLASTKQPLTSSQIANLMGKSLSEIFRMIQVLEARGFIKDIDNQGYELTEKLFTLGLSSTPSRNLLTTCLPYMENLALETGQSCHLVVASGDNIVVIARVEAPGDIGYSVRIGYKRRSIDTLSGAILYGIQPANIQCYLQDLLMKSCTKSEFKNFTERANLVAEQGYITSKSPFVAGVTDIAAPITSNERALAALVIPFISNTINECTVEYATECLQRVTAQISEEI